MSTSFTRGENPLRADKLNQAFSERVSRGGDTMQGMLTLWRNPANPFDAATKQYVDQLAVPPQGATGPPGPPGPMGPPGSVSAGTVTGPLYWTSTGSTTARAAQDRTAEVANVLDFGADPTGASASTTAFRNALATGKDVYVPRGTYLITGQLTLGSATYPQMLYGQGHASVLLINTSFDPTVTTGVIVISGTSATTTDRRAVVQDLVIKFVQPLDLSKLATAISAVGDTTITVADTTGIVVGMQLINWTARNVRGDTHSIPSQAYFTANVATTVASIAGNVVTLTGNVIAGTGVQVNDDIRFASVRSMFKTLANGGTATVGGTGVQYPWAIYCSPAGQTTDLRNLMVISAWNGIYFRGSSFSFARIDMNAFNIGLDIDQCYNFPSITDYRFWQWGSPANEAMVCLNGVYYDGQTIAANFGETDGVGVHNFQSWCGIVNLTTAWSWGEFTNLMMDGNNASLNILSNSGGSVQISNGYSSKGNYTKPGPPIHVNTAANFRTTFTNWNIGLSSPTYSAIVLESGILQFSDTYFWAGMQNASLPFISQTGGTLYLDNVLLDKGGGQVNTYISMTGTAALYMYNCVMVTPPLTPPCNAVLSGVNNPVKFSNVSWNGWSVFAFSNNLNNGVGWIAPLDANSMQSGSLSFDKLLATPHYNTAYGCLALSQIVDSVVNTTAFGSLAGYGARGNGNTFIGATSGYSSAGSTGSFNTAIGAITAYQMTTGAGNTLIGYNCGNAMTTGSGNLHIVAGGINFSYSITENNVFRLGGHATNLMRATGINTATPQFFLDWLPTSTTYANDAAAATGGVLVGQLYRNGSQVMVRVT